MMELVVSALSRSYGATRALQSLDLRVPSGEILGIAGPNGAGKSTLTRILAGEEKSDDGKFYLDGEQWDPYLDRGRVAVVHQEPQIWPNLTPRENLRVSREGGTFPRRSNRRPDEEVLRRLELTNVSDIALENCTLAVQQRVEIGRAMVSNAQCFIFDEPNSALTDDESQALFAFMHELADAGHVVMIISHRLGELVQHCSRVVIIRDGIVARELSGTDITEESIAAELVVESAHSTLEMREQPVERASDASVDAAVILVRNWSSTAFRDVDLELCSSEVTVVMGDEGSGGRELVSSFAGFTRAIGEIEVVREDWASGSREVTFLPADRRQMLFQNLSVGENLVARLGQPDVAIFAGWMKPERIRRLAIDAIGRFGIKTREPSQSISALSGGNQQKIAISAALLTNPAALVIIEPTRGVDVASKRGIYETLRQAARHGLCVVVFCTEATEAFELGGRLLVMHRGQLVMETSVLMFDDVTELAVAVATASSHHTDLTEAEE